MCRGPSILTKFIFDLSDSKFKLYTGKPPHPDLVDRQVPMRVVRGARPPRPFLPDGGRILDSMWSLIQSCWVAKPSDRPSAIEVADTLAAIIGAASQTSDTDRRLDSIRRAVESRIQDGKLVSNHVCFRMLCLTGAISCASNVNGYGPHYHARQIFIFTAPRYL